MNLRNKVVGGIAAVFAIVGGLWYSTPNTNKDYSAEWALSQPMVQGYNLDRGSMIESEYPDPDDNSKMVYPDYRERLRVVSPERKAALMPRITDGFAASGYLVLGTRVYDRYQTWATGGDPVNGPWIDKDKRVKLYVRFRAFDDENGEIHEIPFETLSALASSGQDLNGKQIYSDSEYVICFECEGTFGFDPAKGGAYFVPPRKAAQ